MMHKTAGNATLEIQQGDLTALAVDAIVNAANRHLAHGGGVAGAIARRGGPTLQAESDAYVARHGPVPTGEAVLTGGGRLPARFVIHTVGPVWREHDPAEADRLLCRCVERSLALARDKGLRTVALPAISTGIYGFPVERAAPLLLRTAAGNLSGLERVIFCLYDEPTYRVFAEAFRKLQWPVG